MRFFAETPEQTIRRYTVGDMGGGMPPLPAVPETAKTTAISAPRFDLRIVPGQGRLFISRMGRYWSGCLIEKGSDVRRYLFCRRFDRISG